MNPFRRQRAWPSGFGRGVRAAVWILVGALVVSACEPNERRDKTDENIQVDTGRSRQCRVLERQLAELRGERHALASKRAATRDGLADLEQTIGQLETFEPNLEASSLCVFPGKAPSPREIGGHIRNGTDETVAVMHLDATLVPEAPERDPIEREVAYALQEPLDSGEVQHAPYGQQLIDAYPEVETDVWTEDELQLEVTALEGPNGEILWDRRGGDPDALEARIDELQGELEQRDEQIARLESRLAKLREAPGPCERRSP